MEEAGTAEQMGQTLETMAARRARARAHASRWDLNIAVFLFAILIIVIILAFQQIGAEITAPVAILGLAMVWFVGWRRERQSYQHFYDEELAELQWESQQTISETVADTIETQVQKSLRKRLL